MRLRLACLALLSLLAACGPISEKEPNDHFTQAQPIRPNCKVKGTIGSPSDVDWYRLDVKQEGILNVFVGGIREVDFVLSVQDKDRVELKRFDETGVGGDERALDVGLHPGTYYIVLSNKNPKANNPAQPYLMDVKVEGAAGNEMEPNDTALTANPIEPGGVVRGHYFPTRNLLAAPPLPAGTTDQAVAPSSAAAPAPLPQTTEQGEEDWFKINVAQQGMSLLNIDVSEVPNVDPLLEVYDVNSYKIKELGGAPGEGLRLRNFGVRGPVQYFLRLRAKSKLAGNPDVRYELLTELVPYHGNTEFEPNDQRQDATPFEQDTITGTISPAGDQDWFKVSVKGEGKQILGASLSGLAGMDLVLTLADDLGNPLVTVDNGGKESPEVLTGYGVTKGDYYLVVSEKTGKKADPRQTYTLTKSLTPFQPGLEFEPNNSTGTAQVLKVGESVDGYIAPKGDVDWYQFNVYQKGGILVEATGILNVRLSLSLLDQEYKEIRSASGKKAGDAVSFVLALDPGTYFVRLQATDPGQNNVRDKYTLRLKAQ